MGNLTFEDQPGHWRTGRSDFPRVHLTKISWDDSPHAAAYVFTGHVNVDFDGSPTAYGPPEITAQTDDDLGNAWDEDRGWYGVVAYRDVDPLVKNKTIQIDQRSSQLHKGKYPVIQQAKNGDPKPGFYVSATPRPTGPDYLQNSHIDASDVAFGALSGRLAALGFTLGDFGLAIRHNKSLQSGFYFVDRGGDTYALGECSHKVGKNLGGSGRASHFDNNYPVSFIVFPESGTQDPEGAASMSDDAIRGYVTVLVRKLSTASNADELPLLMGFNEIPPPGLSDGLKKLKAYRDKPTLPRPPNYDTILLGLKAFGWSPLYTPTYNMSL
jgi:hypothetical protein